MEGVDSRGAAVGFKMAGLGNHGRASERSASLASRDYCMDDRRPVQSIDGGGRRPVMVGRSGSRWVDGMVK